MQPGWRGCQRCWQSGLNRCWIIRTEKENYWEPFSCLAVQPSSVSSRRSQIMRAYIIALAIVSIGTVAPAQKLIVHEWGTFTSLQDEAGRTIGGINSEDEALPRFVHELDRGLLIRPGTVV